MTIYLDDPEYFVYDLLCRHGLDPADCEACHTKCARVGCGHESYIHDDEEPFACDDCSCKGFQESAE